MKFGIRMDMNHRRNKSFYLGKEGFLQQLFKYFVH